MQHARKAPFHPFLLPVHAKRSAKAPDVNARNISKSVLLLVMRRA